MQVEDVSVVLPNRNHAHYLRRSIAAILAQTVQPRELIVVDDASTDDSVPLLEELARQHPILRVIRNEKNLGINDSNNAGLRQASGEYVILTAADDVLLPEMIERSLAMLRRHPEAGMSCGYASVVHESTGKMQRNPTPLCGKPRHFPPDELAEVMGHRRLPTTSAVIRREALLRAGGHLTELRWHADSFANLVIAFREGICYIPDTLALMTVREDSYSAIGGRDPLAQQETLFALLRRLLSPEYADVLKLFQYSGVMTVYGKDLVLAAARLPERGTLDVLRLLSGMELATYAELLEHEDPHVRELSEFLLGPMWRQRKQEEDRIRRRRRSPLGMLRKVMTHPRGPMTLLGWYMRGQL
jgi:glycosyltransferase involved in cell wall biosynthesis